MSTELISFNTDEIELLKTTIAKGTTDDQLKLFIQVCRQTGLNPFARQIYAVVRNVKKKDEQGREAWVPEMSIQTSIDGYRLLAQRSNEYQGQDGPYFFDKKTGQWTEYWIESYPPDAARVGVLRKGFTQFLYAVARFESYAARGWNKDTRKYDGDLVNLWAKMPEVMIAKVAEALALRRAFPAELSGVYTKEEMDQADMPLPTPDIQVTPVQSQDEPEPAQSVAGEVVEALENIPTPSELRRRCADMQMTTKTGTPVTLDHVKRHVLKKEVADDELTPDECSKLSQFIDRQNSKAA